jgi:hypothetical protein
MTIEDPGKGLRGDLNLPGDARHRQIRPRLGSPGRVNESGIMKPPQRTPERRQPQHNPQLLRHRGLPAWDQKTRLGQTTGGRKLRRLEKLVERNTQRQPD